MDRHPVAHFLFWRVAVPALVPAGLVGAGILAIAPLEGAALSALATWLVSTLAILFLPLAKPY